MQNILIENTCQVNCILNSASGELVTDIGLSYQLMT
jgi:hypothetical protein